MGSGAWDPGFGVEVGGLGFGVWDLGFGVWGLGFGVEVSGVRTGLRATGEGEREGLVDGLGVRFQVSGFRMEQTLPAILR